MEVRFLGTGGPGGWPEQDCRCASCMRMKTSSNARRPAEVLIDGRLRLMPGQPPGPRGGGYRVEPVRGGWDLTGPDGTRLLAAGGPALIPDPPGGTAGYDIALLDLLHSAAQLGALRRRGLLAGPAIAAALYADHRIASEQELARRCRHWRAASPADGRALGAAPAGTDVRPHRTLILGGARSGKSREAELRLAGEPRVTYLAAGPWPDGGADGPDAEWERRVAAHRAARPRWWPTIETTDVAGALRRLRGAVLIDGIGTWLAAAMTEAGAWQAAGEAAPAAQAAQAGLAARLDDLVAAWRQTRARVVAVSDQVGSGIVPATPAGRSFRDQLGWLNQRLAAESEEAVLVVAGRVLSALG
jgi:adenosylcobinamide kinase / adenosylcobinamide-phosphate guanylyltransferase